MGANHILVIDSNEGKNAGLAWFLVPGEESLGRYKIRGPVGAVAELKLHEPSMLIIGRPGDDPRVIDEILNYCSSKNIPVLDLGSGLPSEKVCETDAAKQGRSSERPPARPSPPLMDVPRRLAPDEKQKSQNAGNGILGRESSYRSLLNMLSDDVIVIDPKFRVVEANTAALGARVPGSSELTGRLCYKAIFGLEGPCADYGHDCPLAKVIETGAAAKTQKTLVGADGEERVLDIAASPLFGERGEVAGVIEAFRDVTSLANARTRLRESRSRLASVLDSAPMGIALLANGEIIEANGKLAKLMDRDLRDIVGLNLCDLIAPDAVIIGPDITEKGETGYSIESAWQRPDGSWMDVFISASRIEAAGDEEAIEEMITVLDITAAKDIQREKEKAFRQARQNARESSFLLEGARAILEWSDFEQVAKRIFDIAKDMVSADGGLVAILDQASELNDIIHLDPGKRGMDIDPAALVSVEGIGKEVYLTGNGFINNTPDKSRRSPAAAIEDGFDNILLAPLAADNEVRGFLCLFNKREDFTQEDLRIVSAFSELLAVAYNGHRTREALRSSEDRFRTIIENNADAILVVNAGGQVRYVNAAGEKLLGRSRFEIVGDVFGFPLVKGETAGVDLVDAEGRSVSAEMRSVETIWNGQDAMIVTLRDVTDRKQAENRVKRIHDFYASAISNIPSMILILDQRLHLVMANESFLRRKGVGAEELEGAHLVSLLSEAVMEDGGLLGRVRRVAEFGGGDEILDMREVFGERDDSWYNIQFRRIASLEGEDQVMVVINDVSNETRLRNELQQSQKLEAIGRLAGGVAHDFNNQLTVILSLSEMLVKSLKTDDPLYMDAMDIRDAAERSAALTRQLLVFSRKEVLEPEVLDLNRVVVDLEKMLGRLIGEDIELATNLSRELGEVKADPSHIEQVIVNLVVNARDAMPRGGKLAIETFNSTLDEANLERHPDMTPGDYAVLSVVDTGVGMDEQVKNRIFEPFFTTKGKEQGTGLGLSTVYGIVKQSGGHIWVYSEPGMGTAFKVYLPLLEGEESVESGGSEKRADHARGSESILLVEDDDMIRASTLRFLRSLGYNTMEAKNAGEAMLIFEKDKETVDLLFTDVVMPFMSGPELANKLRKHQPDLKVLFMSGYTNDAISRHGFTAENARLLQKPFSLDDLARRVRETLDG